MPKVGIMSVSSANRSGDGEVSSREDFTGRAEINLVRCCQVFTKHSIFHIKVDQTPRHLNATPKACD